MYETDRTQTVKERMLLVDGLAEPDASTMEFLDMSTSGIVLDDSSEV